MKSTELRIGNFVKCTEPQMADYFICQSVPKDDDNFYKWIEPIPLTEEWLLKLGFDERMYGWWSENIYLRNDENKDFFWFDWDGTNESKGTHIQYVHQLQNLYFALTGEELTLKS